MGRGGRTRSAVLLVALLILPGCAAYHERMQAVEAPLVAGEPRKALQALEADGENAAERDLPLYLLNRGLLLFQLEDWDGAIQTLSQAARLLEEAAVLSVGEQAAAVSVNEGRRSYAGAPYERRLVHVFLALAYLRAGRLDEARVEALQIDLVSQVLAQQGEPEDPFARWLAGMIFEALGEWDQARVAYRKALEAYEDRDSPYALPVPPTLQRDLVRVTAALGLDDEARRLRERFALADDATELDPRRSARLAQVVLIYLDNLAPLWLESSLLIHDPESGRLVRIALPYPVPRPSPVARAEFHLGPHSVVLEKAEDVARLSQQALERQMPKLLARAIARALVKSEATRKAHKEDALLGVMVNLIGVLSERADTRTWQLLPDNFRLARLFLPPGDYRGELGLYDARGRVLARLSLGEWALEAGETRFLTARWIDPGVLQAWEAAPDDEWIRIHVYHED